MGVPKFFRYISERYPCLSELAREQHIPEFDNLYLDMNGIIHNCTHPDDTNINLHLSEEQMFEDIFNYISRLFFLIKPQKLFFMAVDGVAPRAKMNQQRCRRFRSAKDDELLEKIAERRGEVRQHERFDKNCITPGTVFMARLHDALRRFIKSKVRSDPLWQQCTVLLSGHDSPGEGEHKIMDYIRYLKSQKDYSTRNTRHCLYGLDADLIILGLCTHEMHFVILREEVQFGKQKKTTSVEETKFYLLHLSLLREYLELEFQELKQHDKFNIGNLIDDWILLGFLVGNDFIPHLPGLHISSNALPLLYKTYIKVYPSLGGNINVHGKLNLKRLEKFFEALMDVEYDIFQENHADLKYFEAKRNQNGIDEAFDFNTADIISTNIDDDLSALIEDSRQLLEDGEEDLSDENQHLLNEFENYKRSYYLNKLKQNDMNSEVQREQAICYITALQWILDYYYCGVQSWEWYYPHHYAPFICDLKNFSDHKFNFKLGKPFQPFQQLLAILPAASKDLVPLAYRHLMTDADSEIKHFYPDNFETDLNGKQHDWEAIVLIPFIDEKILIKAMAACEKNLTNEEKKRNRHGPMLQYVYNAESQNSSAGVCSTHPPIENNFCTEKAICTQAVIPSKKCVCVEMPNNGRKQVFLPGFPTMKYLDFDFELKNCGIKVFNYCSRNVSMILKPKNRKDFDDVFIIAKKLLNRTVYIGWPHLIKTKVVAVSSRQKYIDDSGIRDARINQFDMKIREINEHLKNRMGIEFKDMSVIVYVRTNLGASYSCNGQGKIIINEMWSRNTIAYPAQGVVTKITVRNPSENYKCIEDMYSENSRIFFIGNPYYGSEGVIMNPKLVYECGRLKVNITVLPEPDFKDAICLQNELQDRYISAQEIAASLGVGIRGLTTLTSSVYVLPGQRCTTDDGLADKLKPVDIGLKFKNFRKQEVLAGYCKLVDKQTYYVYSTKAVELVKAYCTHFPAVIECLSRYTPNHRKGFFYEEDIFIAEDYKLDDVVKWLKEQDHQKAEAIPCGSELLQKEAVEAIITAVEELKNLPVKTVKLQVKPYLLLKPNVSLPETYRALRPIRLFDRVVIVKDTYMVPLGYKGTVVSIYPVMDPNPVRFECVKVVNYFYGILFDKHIPHGNDLYGIAKQRVYKVPETSLLVLSLTMDDHTENHKPLSANSASSEMKATSVPSIQQPVENSKIRENLQKNPIERPVAVAKRSNDEFWMPAVNTKFKHSNPSVGIVVPTTTTNAGYNGNELPADHPINTAVVETQRLKSILGLLDNKSTPSVRTTTQNTGAPIKQMPLPQPPTVWCNDAQMMSKQQLESQSPSTAATPSTTAIRSAAQQLQAQPVPPGPPASSGSTVLSSGQAPPALPIPAGPSGSPGPQTMPTPPSPAGVAAPSLTQYYPVEQQSPSVVSLHYSPTVNFLSYQSTYPFLAPNATLAPYLYQNPMNYSTTPPFYQSHPVLTQYPPPPQSLKPSYSNSYTSKLNNLYTTGAFIPLQVARKYPFSRHIENHYPAGNNLDVIQNNIHQIKLDNNTKLNSNTNNTSVTSPATAVINQIDSRERKPPPPPRIPKIAAKFSKQSTTLQTE